MNSLMLAIISMVLGLGQSPDSQITLGEVRSFHSAILN